MSMFPSTLPMDAPDSRPPAVGAAARAAEAAAVAGRVPGGALHTALSSLSPSLMQDLLRFDEDKPQRELLEVLAAGVRHTQPLAIGLAWAQQTLVLSVFPAQRLVHCPLPMADVLAGNLEAMQVRQVQPATLRPPGSAEPARIGNPVHYAPLGPLLWAVALRGSRDALLPELAGQAAYRVSPGMSLSGLDVPGAMAACISRLRRKTSNLREIAAWYDIGPQRATRLLNALYLQSGLIVSRTHPAATNEGWTGYDK
jgi:hypothetical protein